LFNGLDLGFRTPYKRRKVPNLNKFTYEKFTRRIVQEHVKKVSVTGGNPISILIHTLIKKNISEDPIVIASIGTAFTREIEDNVHNSWCQNLEEAKTKELE
jgi:hypothetical protein